jgi:hypothetical protein
MRDREEKLDLPVEGFAIEERQLKTKVDADEILPEYDFSRARPNKYASQIERLTASQEPVKPSDEVE